MLDGMGGMRLLAFEPCVEWDGRHMLKGRGGGQEELQRVRLERDAEAQRLTAQLDESRKSVASLQDALPKVS